MHHMAESAGCPGCGGEGFSLSCAIVTCSRRHGDVEYCFLCADYPCDRYREESVFDSFIVHRNVLKDFDQARADGLAAYHSRLDEKIAILRTLMANYTDGRRKSFFCTAVNLLALADIKKVMRQVDKAVKPGNTLKENAAIVVGLFQAMAEKRDIVIKLIKKRREK